MQRFAQRCESLCRTPVGADAIRVIPLQLEQAGNISEDGAKLLIIRIIHTDGTVASVLVQRYVYRLDHDKRWSQCQSRRARVHGGVRDHDGTVAQCAPSPLSDTTAVCGDCHRVAQYPTFL